MYCICKKNALSSLQVPHKLGVHVTSFIHNTLRMPLSLYQKTGYRVLSDVMYVTQYTKFGTQHPPYYFTDRLEVAASWSIQIAIQRFFTQHTRYFFSWFIIQYAVLTCYICSIRLSLFLVPASCLCVTDAPVQTSDCTSELCGLHFSLV